MEQDPIQTLANFRYLLDKLVYAKTANNYMVVRKRILKELSRLVDDFKNDTVVPVTFKDSFKLRKSYLENTYEICTTSHWSVAINTSTIPNLVYFLETEGIRKKSHETIS